jgi:hypothetical protein
VGSFVFIALFAAVDNGSRARARPAAFDVADELRSGWVTDVAKALSAMGTLPVVGTVGRRGRVPRPPPRGDRRAARHARPC